MKPGTLVSLLVVAAISFFAAWQFSPWFRSKLGLKGRPLDVLFGTGSTNNQAALGGPSFGDYAAAVNDVSSGWAGSLTNANMPTVSKPPGSMPSSRPRSITVQ